MKVLYYWLTMGHYHLARMEALQDIPGIDLHVWEATNKDDHFWDLDTGNLNNYDVFYPGEFLDSKVVAKAAFRLAHRLQKYEFDVFVNGAGYFHPAMLYPILVAQPSEMKVLLWSESTFNDQRRKKLGEWTKKQVLNLYDGALVAGRRHRRYLQQLGMAPGRIAEVGNVVDNNFFTSDEQKNRSGFLYVGRFLPIKNISFLIEAYEIYQKKCLEVGAQIEPLYLVGDGPEKNMLEAQVNDKKLEQVTFTGNLQPDEVRRYYKCASVFVLPSLSEPWGLVVNEAMSSAMPVLVSGKCGCVPELLSHGENGYIIDPTDQYQLADRMFELSLDFAKKHNMGQTGLQIIQRFTPETYAEACYTHFKKVAGDDV